MCDKIDLKNLRLRNFLIYQNDWSFANITTLYVKIGTAEKIKIRQAILSPKLSFYWASQASEAGNNSKIITSIYLKPA